MSRIFEDPPVLSKVSVEEPEPPILCAASATGSLRFWLWTRSIAKCCGSASAIFSGFRVQGVASGAASVPSLVILVNKDGFL